MATSSENLPPAHQPPGWREFRARTSGHWARQILVIDWFFDYCAWRLGQWSLLKLLAYLETFSVLVAIIFWVAETGQRTQQKHYQAWQVINTAQGKGGSGGRVDALEQLNDDHVPLVGVDVAEAFLQNVHLNGAELRRATLRACDLRNAHFRRASLPDADLTFANLRDADLRGADLTDATLVDADFTGADLTGANLHGASLDRADLREANLADVKDWTAISSMRLANIHGIHSAPDGFVKWATEHGAVQILQTNDWEALQKASAPTK